MVIGYNSFYEHYSDYMRAVSVYLSEYMVYLKSLPETDTPPLDKYKGIAVSADQAESFSAVFSFMLSHERHETVRNILYEIKQKASNTEIFLPFDYICSVFSIQGADKLAVMACFLVCMYPLL